MKQITSCGLILAAAVLLLAGQPSRGEEYAPGVLIEAKELRRLIETSDSSLVVLDVRSPDQRRHGSLPGAKAVGGFFDFRSAFQANGRLRPDTGVGMTLAHFFGQHPPSRVVLVGESLDPSVARAWWQLRYLDIEGAQVLNGGWRAWQAVDGPIEQGEGKLLVGDHVGPAISLVVQPQQDRLAEGTQLKGLLTRGEAPKLIDARSEREYAAGCVPGAKRLEWSELVDAESGKLLPADELREQFASIGVDPKEPTISYCRTGGRASVTVLALAALGSEQAANYYGSWTEWQASEAAVLAKEVGP